MRADEVGDFFLPGLQGRKKKRGVGQLIFIGRFVQHLESFCTGSLFFFWGARETEMPEGVLVIDQQLIEESVGRIHAMAEDDVAKLVSDYGGEAGLVRQHVNQAAA